MDDRVSVKGTGISVVNALEQIEKQTQISIAYNKSQLSSLGNVTLNLDDVTISRALAAVLQGTGYTYSVEGNHVVIVAAPKETRRTGKISNSDAEPIAGATIIVKETGAGAVSFADGSYSIMAMDNATLVVSSLGFTTQEVNIGTRASTDIVLPYDAQRLDEVIVVGYNRISRAQNTGSLSVVAGEKMEYQSAPTLEQRLQGMVPGVMISSGSGQPGTDYLTIRIRGTGSINGSKTPLYIMDGVMVEPGQFAALNSNDIADIKILKDAASTAIYGSRGANGVIVITTKEGQRGKTKINYRNMFGFSYLPEYVDMMNTEQNLQYQLQAVLTNPSSQTYPLMQTLLKEHNTPGDLTDAEKARLAKARSTDTDWIDEMLRTGFLQEHNISLSGGTDNVRYFVSGAYMSQDGVLKKSGIDSYSGRFNIDMKATKWLDFGLKLTTGYSQVNFSDPSGSGNRQSYINPWFTALLAYPYEDPDTWYNKDNPTLLTKYRNEKTNKLKMVGSVYANLRFTDWLSFNTNFGMDFMYNRTTSTLHRDHPSAQTNHGSYSNSSSELGRYTWTNTLSFNKTVAPGHDINAVAGIEMFQGKWFSSGFTGYDLNPNMMDSPAGIGDKNGTSEFPPTISGGRTMNNLFSLFFQGSYSMFNKYNVSASVRRDQSSKFASGNKSQVFWSVGGSWLLNREGWLEDVSWLNVLKLRASYGTTGNQDGVADFGTVEGYSSSSYAGISGYNHSQIGNPNLFWETSQQTNLGFDISVLDSRLSATVDLYHIKTKDLFMPYNLSPTSGFSSIWTNAGSIVNRGIELGINGTPVRTKNFKWDIGFNITFNQNKIKDLGTFAVDGQKSYISGSTIYEIGRPMGTWYIEKWAGVDPNTGYVLFQTASGERTPVIQDVEKMSDYGTSEIPIFGGFNTTLRWKGLSLNAMFTFALNYTIMNTMRWYIYNHNFNGNKPVEMLNMWMKPGDVTDIPKFDFTYNPSPMASQFLEDASFLRLKTLRLNYTLPQSVVKRLKIFESISVYAQAENVFTITKYTGGDPEVSGSYDYMSFPKPRTFTFGLDINF